MSKKLSIITVVYNGEKYLEDTIKSVIFQKDESVEYIIIDGGSNDSTMDIVKKYENYIDTIVSEKDNGIYNAMNKGARVATGDFLIFLNSDDYYRENIIKSFYKSLSNKPDIVIMNTLIKNEFGVEKLFKREINKNNYKLHIRLPFMHPSVFVSRQFFNLIGGFNENYKIASDCEFLLKMLSKSDRLEYINESVVMRVGGVSDSGYLKGRSEYRQIYSEFSGSVFWAWMGFFESVMIYFLFKIIRGIK